MSQHHSNKAIYTALFTNVSLGILKIIAYIFTGSVALLSEGVHSIADSSNQLLLLYGLKKSKEAPNSKFNFGQGKQVFLYSFIVAIILFSMGGLYSIYEGIHKIIHPEPIENAKLILVVLGLLFVGFIGEGRSFLLALKEQKRENPKQSLLNYIKKSTNLPNIVILLEDGGALLGLFFAFIFILLGYFINPIFDGIGAVFIGLLLISMAYILFRESSSTLIGESLSESETYKIYQILKRYNIFDCEVRTFAKGIGEYLIIIDFPIENNLSMEEFKDLYDNIKTEIENNFKNSVISLIPIEIKE